ncbi:MAG: chromosome partitioning protein [Catenulispora sp.]
MTLLMAGSVKGSPGVSTMAMALAVVWPVGPRVLLVEADPAGGDIQSWWGRADTPGLVTLAVAARREAGDGLVWQHAQRLPGGLEVLVGPAGTDQAKAAWTVLASRAGSLFDALACDPRVLAIVDAGRLDPASPVLGLLDNAGLCLVATRPRLPDLAHVAARLPTLARPGAVGVVLVGTGSYGAADVEAALGVPVVGELPADARGAAAVCGRAGLRRWQVERLPMLRSARLLAEHLVDALACRPVRRAAPGRVAGRLPATPVRPHEPTARPAVAGRPQLSHEGEPQR